MATPAPPKMDYMIRFIQVHETFRLAEIEALAALEGINLEILSYSLSVCYFPETLRSNIDIDIGSRPIALFVWSPRTLQEDW